MRKGDNGLAIMCAQGEEDDGVGEVGVTLEVVEDVWVVGVVG
jgi:hypothetical protein